jgi:hypothetical protein
MVRWSFSEVQDDRDVHRYHVNIRVRVKGSSEA